MFGVESLVLGLTDSTAAFCLGGGSVMEHARLWLAAAGVTVLFYGSARILAQICSYRMDRLDRPLRPLPSGRVSLAEAWAATTSLVALAFAWVWHSFRPGLPIAGSLIVLMLVYRPFFNQGRIHRLLVVFGRVAAFVLAATAGAMAGSVPPSETRADPGSAGLMVAWGMYLFGIAGVARDELAIELTLRQKTGIALMGVSLAVPVVLGPSVSSGVMVAFLVAFCWILHVTAQTVSRRIDAVRTLGSLLAGVCLFDALILARAGFFGGVLMAWGAFWILRSRHRDD